MTSPVDAELQAWQQDWAGEPAPSNAVERLRQHVRRRDRWHRVWVAADTVVGLVMLVFIAWMAVTLPDPIDRAAMVPFAAIAVGALAFAWWNWLGARPPLTESTTTFLAVSEERCRVLGRAVRAAWVILAAEAVVFVPFLSVQIGSPFARPLPWLFLAGMLGLGAAASFGLGRWSRREARVVRELRCEIEGSPAE